MPEKVWKKEPLTFEQFEDLWEQNNKLELAKVYLVALKESESAPLEDKIRFLSRVLSGCAINLRAHLVDPESSEILSLAAKTFLEIMPKCDYMIHPELMEYLGKLTDEQKKGWENKIKTFAHSYLDNAVNKKVILDSPVVANMLIHNRMFEELVNYGFTSDSAIDILWLFIFRGTDTFGFFLGHGHGLIADDFLTEAGRARYRFNKISEALRENREPHAVSALLRLLAKRGDLDKIFSAPAETK